MEIFNKPRGTYDLFDQQMCDFNYITTKLAKIANNFGYKQIVTPIFEYRDLFVRNIGSTSDIVTKEFYDFVDKSNRQMVLRPEGTVPIIRSVIENKMLSLTNSNIKLFYIGPMFRYERPQNGRNRQFYQFGIENINIKSIYDQIETLMLGVEILDSFDIKNYQLKINYIGGIDSRQKWIDSLKKYFNSYIDELSDDSKNRIDKNPLRILDDKVDSKKEFVKNAPKIKEFLTENEINEFDQLINNLNKLKINYQIDTNLVRGLDYYFGLVFEFVSLDKELSFSTIIGGGKYSNLTKELGGIDTDCIGFAIGIERLIKAWQLENQSQTKNGIDIYFANICDDKLFGLKIINKLRKMGYSVESNFEFNKLDKHFKLASKLNSKIIIILGNKEYNDKKIIIKNQSNMIEKSISIDLIELEIKEILK